MKTRFIYTNISTLKRLGIKGLFAAILVISIIFSFAHVASADLRDDARQGLEMRLENLERTKAEAKKVLDKLKAKRDTWTENYKKVLNTMQTINVLEMEVRNIHRKNALKIMGKYSISAGFTMASVLSPGGTVGALIGAGVGIFVADPLIEKISEWAGVGGTIGERITANLESLKDAPKLDKLITVLNYTDSDIKEIARRNLGDPDAKPSPDLQAMLRGKVYLQAIAEAAPDLSKLKRTLSSSNETIRNKISQIESKLRIIERDIQYAKQQLATGDAIESSKLNAPKTPAVLPRTAGAMDFSAAAQKITSATNSLFSNQISGKVYVALLSQARGGARKYIVDLVNQAPDNKKNAVRAQANQDYNDIVRVADNKANKRVEAKKQEGIAWRKAVSEWLKEPVPIVNYSHSGVPLDNNGMPTPWGQRGNVGQSLASMTWSGGLSKLQRIEYDFTTIDGIWSNRFETSKQAYSQNYGEHWDKKYAGAKNLYSDMEIASAAASGIAAQAGNFARPVADNIAVWEFSGITSPMNSYSKLEDAYPILATFNESFQTTLAMYKSQAKKMIDSFTPKAVRVESAIMAMKNLPAAYDTVDKILEIVKKSRPSINGQHDYILKWLNSRGASKDGIERVKTAISSSGAASLEEYVISLFPNVLRGRGGIKKFTRPRPFPTVDDVNKMRQEYKKMAMELSSKREAYLEVYNPYVREWDKLKSLCNKMSQALTAIYPNAGPQVTPTAIIGSTRPTNALEIIARYNLAEPIGDPFFGKQELITNYAAAIGAYWSQVEPMLGKVMFGDITATGKIDSLASKLEANGSAWAKQGRDYYQQQMNELWNQVNELMQPLIRRNLNRGRLRDSYSAFMTASQKMSTLAAKMESQDSAALAARQLQNAIETNKSVLNKSGVGAQETISRAISLLTQAISGASQYKTHSKVQQAIAAGQSLIDELNGRLQELSQKGLAKIKEFYDEFSRAYSSRDEVAVISMLSEDWTGSGGASLDEVEELLVNSFSVFDSIEHKITGLNVEDMGNGTFRARYTTEITGRIEDQDLTHNEKSSITEILKEENGKLKVLTTSGGGHFIQ